MSASLFTRVCLLLLIPGSVQAQMPAATQPLTMEGDLASQMVDGIDGFLLKQIELAKIQRKNFWNYDNTSPQAFEKSIQPNRDRLARMLGVRDDRVPAQTPFDSGPLDDSTVIAECEAFRVYRIRWPVLPDPAPTAKHLSSIHGEGLMLVPNGSIIANVIAMPDAQQTPEQIAGLADGVPEASQFARELAKRGCRVVVPMLVDRSLSKRNGRAILTNREYLYRSAFDLGRHIIGYEIQKVQSVLDWFEASDSMSKVATGIIGYGEGGLLSLYASAIDNRIDSVCVSGAFGPRESVWKEPLDRNVFGLLQEFGAAETAIMVQPRSLIVEAGAWPEIEIGGEGGGPGSLKTPSQQAVREEFDIVESFARRLTFRQSGQPSVVGIFDVGDEFCGTDTLTSFLSSLAPTKQAAASTASPESQRLQTSLDIPRHIESRQLRQNEEIDRHNQALLRESAFVRKKFFKKLNTSTIEKYESSVEAYRKIFREDVIGEFDIPLLPFNARSRKSWDNEKWTGHEVVLDVFPGVLAYGVLLLPKGLKAGEKRPVVVCQHGLEGRPTDTFLDDHRAYHDFAAKLCEQGYITFAPQNCYIFKDRFRTLQRKANSIGNTLFSIIVPQHQQIVNWLKTQPNVDAERIAFYGLSYGGKSAMRIPALVEDYCLSICSADFNEWVRKVSSTRDNFSYAWTGEYEIFEWNLGSTFNYAEMAALICPRPFMVERGHFDGVGTDEWVAFEYAKIRNLYAARLGIGDRTEIEWFVGPHMINGKGTFRFLHKHLQQPK